MICKTELLLLTADTAVPVSAIVGLPVLTGLVIISVIECGSNNVSASLAKQGLRFGCFRALNSCVSGNLACYSANGTGVRVTVRLFVSVFFGIVGMLREITVRLAAGITPCKLDAGCGAARAGLSIGNVCTAGNGAF